MNSYYGNLLQIEKYFRAIGQSVFTMLRNYAITSIHKHVNVIVLNIMVKHI